MPGTITFKPIEAKLNHDTDLIGKADPYCMFTVGHQKIKGQVCKSGGKHPVWNDSITIPATPEQPICLVEIKDKDILKDDKMGSFEIDLREIECQGKLQKWYPVYHKNKPAGELLMEAVYTPDMHMHAQGGIGMPLKTGMQMGMTNNMMTGAGGIPVSFTNGHGHGHGNSTTTQKTQVITKETHLIGGAPLNTNIHTHIPPTQGIPTTAYNQTIFTNESSADRYAKEALIRGVDPLGTHFHQNQTHTHTQYPQQMVGNNVIHGQRIDAHNYGGHGNHHHDQHYPTQQMTFGHGKNPNKF